MKRPSSFAGFRWFLILTLVIGVALASVYFLPFATIAGWLSSLASDGNFESFTVERHQAISKLAGLLGLVLTVVPGLALIKWAETQKIIGKISTAVRAFNTSLRSDARSFLSELSLFKWTRAELWLMFGLILAALITRLASLNIPLTHDEAYTYNAFASRSLWVTLSDYHLPNNHIFLTIIINILTHVFGNHVWLIRLPTIVAGILMVPAAYVLGRRLYSREAGLLSAALVVVFPVLVEYSVLARGYAFVNLFTLLILVFGDQVRENKNRFIWLLLIITNALGFFTIPIMMFPFGALYIWLFLSCVVGDSRGYRSQLDFLKYWLVSGFASAFLTVLLYAPILLTDSENFFGNSFVAPLSRKTFSTVLVSRLELTWMDWMKVIPDWLVVLGVIGFALSMLLHFKISKPKIPQQIAFFLWIAAYLIARRPSMMERMWLFLVAPVLIWSAGGIIETLRWGSGLFRRKLPLAQTFLGVSLAALFLFGMLTIPTIPERWSQKSSVEKAALYLKENIRNGDLVTASVEYFPQLRYYFGIYEVDQNYLRKSGQFQRALIVMGKRNTLEEALPKMGSNSDRPAVNMDTLKIILEFDDLFVYEGEPVP